MRRATLTLLLLPTLALASSPGDPVRAARRSGEITVDGRLEEATWDAAPVHDGFFQAFPLAGAPPSERTEVRVLFDDRALYVGVTCHDGRPGEIARPLGRRDDPPYSDSVMVLVDSMHDRRTAYAFEVNAAGVQRDSLLYGDDQVNPDWDAVWDGAAATLPDGWSAELVIPLSVLRFSGAREQTWGFAVKRVLARTHEDLFTVALRRGDKGVVGRLGELGGLAGLTPVQDLSLSPYLASRLTWRPQFDDDTRPTPRLVDPTGDLGLDVKASLGRGLALQATVNPDFGQVEADQLVQNLSTFELFFPEKRPFFTQGLDLFQGIVPPDHRSPQQLFYSRRIGLDAPILGAAKVAGRVSDGVQVGLLEALVTGAGAPAGSTEAAPLRRYRFDPAQPLHFGPAGSLPALSPASRNLLAAVARWQPAATATLDASVASALPLGPPCRPEDAVLSDRPSRCDVLTGNAMTLAASLRSADGDWYARGQLTGSQYLAGEDDGAPDARGRLARTLADGTVLQRGDLGWGAALYAGRQGGEPWRFDLAWEYESPRLELNATGFQPTQNEQQVRGVLHYLRPGGQGPFHSYDVQVGGRLQGTTDGSGRRRGAQAWLRSEFQLRSFHWLGLNAFAEPPSDDVREIEGSGTAFRTTGFWLLEPWLSSDRGRPIWLEGWLDLGRAPGAGAVPGVRFWEVGASTVLRPHARLETRLDLVVSTSRWPARWVEAGPAPGQQLFAALEAPILSLTLRQQLVLGPRLTVRAYAQLFSATSRSGPSYTGAAPAGGRIRLADLTPGGAPSALPGEHESALNLSVVARWEYRLGSTFYLVYTRSAAEPAWTGGGAPPFTLRPYRLSRGPTTDTVLLKWSWYWSA